MSYTRESGEVTLLDRWPVTDDAIVAAASATHTALPKRPLW